MHWTDLLERRYFPPEAMVVADVHCIGCGYNVRGTRAVGRCPECGRAVADSLFRCTSPRETADSLRALGRGFGFVLLGIVAGIAQSTGQAPGCAAIIMLAGIGFRWFAVRDLQRRSGLASVPVAGDGMRRLAQSLLVEIGVGALTLAMSIAVHYAGSNGAFTTAAQEAAAHRAVTIAFLSWGAIQLLELIFAAQMAGGFAALLDWSWLASRFRIAARLAAAAIGAVAVVMFMLPLSGGWTASILFIPLVAALLGVLLCAVSVIVVWTELLRLATAVEQAPLDRDDAIDRPRISLAEISRRKEEAAAAAAPKAKPAPRRPR